MAANLYNITTQNNSSSSCPQEPDDISLFLQQIILRSSSSSSSSFTRHQSFAALSDHPLGMSPGQISAPDPSPGLNSSSGCSFTAANAPSSSVGKLDNEADEYDYESEEVIEAVVEETAPKPTPPRSSSKRSRAAEVHNLSEKRRRSRINEKMKALQNLIPNSNKTDKASMLDEAIEYLKQLQLQVQMLTMRNGLSLYPICVPGMMQPNHTSQMRMDVYDTDKFSNVNMAKSISMDQNISADALLRVQDKCINQAPLTDFSSMIGSKTSFGVESSMQDHFGTFQRSRSSKGICEEKVRLCQPLNDDCPHQTSSTGAKAYISNLKEVSLEACLAGAGAGSGGGDHHLLQNFINHPIFSPHELNM